MTQRMIKPARPDLIVRRPDNGNPLPAEGAPVTWSAYWERRLLDGSVIDVPADKTKAKAGADAAPAKQEVTK